MRVARPLQVRLDLFVSPFQAAFKVQGLRLERRGQLPQAHRVEGPRLVGFENPQVLIELTRLVLRLDDGTTHIEPISRLHDLLAVPGGKLDCIYSRAKINVVRIGLDAGLAVAEIPHGLALHRQGLGRDVVKGDVHQDQGIVRQGHFAADLHIEVGGQFSRPQVHAPGNKCPTRCWLKASGGRGEGLSLTLVGCGTQARTITAARSPAAA